LRALKAGLPKETKLALVLEAPGTESPDLKEMVAWGVEAVWAESVALRSNTRKGRGKNLIKINTLYSAKALKPVVNPSLPSYHCPSDTGGTIISGMIPTGGVSRDSAM
jgi:hypothetical protein